ncbi:glycosyltransferase family 2 protein [Robertmurraya kyonggiensis]|uniref:Glycosyltransferase family 2 protein n=1 Tax=Robertmurraya kyonggiensis TaxID=1037680 RepID=A0A4U1D9D4_9BACI|nr:glycosyltransferase family 2 protein [Robertmurraya kyonggiensis]TKC19111.1 glycosyltransferase family 2 protein [Robertmurraya kyonggiensis]
MISIIIPVYNQSKSLDYVLEAFQLQHYNESFEIVLIDDGSTDELTTIIDKYINDSKFNLKIIRNKVNMGRAYSRNVGIKYSNGEILIFNDSDRIPSKNFLKNHINFLKNHPGSICIGEVKELYYSIDNLNEIWNAVLSDGRMARKATYYRVIENLFNNLGDTDSKISWLATLTGNMAVRREDLCETFDEFFIEWGFEHFELGYRLIQQKKSIRLNRSATNYHIAHARNKDYYNENLYKSHSKFVEKHNAKEILMLIDFIQGKLSLQDYEMQIDGKKKWLLEKNKPIFNTILNY